MSRTRDCRGFTLILLLLTSLVLTAGSASAIGTPVLVKDINPGSASSSPASLVRVGDKLFFASQDGVNGVEPWVSDATTSGTTLLMDIWTGFNGGMPSCPWCNPVQIGAIVYFIATDDGGYKLWRTDGTTAGTWNVSTVYGAGNLENVSGTLFFSAEGFLFTSDGTAGGTAQVTNQVYVAGDLTDVNGTLFFAGDNGATGWEICRSDGTAGGTSVVKDLRPGIDGSGAVLLTNVGGTLFFAATDGVAYGLCKSDGTSAGTFLLKPLTMEANQFATGQIVNANGTAFLVASDGVNGVELWKSDGTAGGTVMVKDILPGSGSGLGAIGTASLVAIGSTVYFAASDGAVGRELWNSDGTAAGTVMVKDIYPGFGNFGSSNPAALANVNGRLFFRAESPSVGGSQPWTSDGTEAGTVQIAVMNPTGGSCIAQFFTAVGNNIFFSGTDGSSGIELWVMSNDPVGVGPSGGSASGVVSLAQNYPNPVRATTQIAYSIPAGQNVSLKLYDVSGREVRTLVNERQSAGAYRVEMDVRGLLPSGVYFYLLETEYGVPQKRKMVLVR